MSSKTYVRISLERQKLILGQIGNMRARVADLRLVLANADQLEFEVYLRGVEIELEYFEKYFPTIPDNFPF